MSSNSNNSTSGGASTGSNSGSSSPNSISRGFTLVLSASVASLALAGYWYYWRTQQVQSPQQQQLARKKKKPLILGHRGYGCRQPGLPENTLISFQKAIDELSGLETDVRITSDGEYVCMHDHELPDGRLVDNVTLKEVQSVVLEEKQHIPTVKELLDIVPEPTFQRRFQLILELKDAKFKLFAYIQAFIKYLQQNKILHKVAKMSCFNHEVLSHAKKVLDEIHDDKVQVALCPLYNRDDTPFPQDFPSTFDDFRAAEYHCSAIHITSETVHKIQDLSAEALVWFPGSKRETIENLTEIVDVGADSIITNSPQMLQQVLAIKFPQ